MRYAIGLDVGITSVGYAIVELNEKDLPYKIQRLGSRIFKSAENPEDGSSLALPRREARSMRRRIRRRRHRKERVRNLIVTSGLLTSEQLNGLYIGKGQPDIYRLRTEALDRVLSREELARVLIHLSQRRGFKSNARGEKSDDGKLKAAISENAAKMLENGYRTVGEMLFKDIRFAEHKRNKSDYLNTVTRDMVEDEVRLIFARQQELGNKVASPEIMEAFLSILLSQRSFFEGPGKPSPYAFDESLIAERIGFCQFEKEERRAPKAAYSFEYFRLLQTLNNLHLIERDGQAISLSQEQRNAVIELAHKHEKVTFGQIRKKLKISEESTFNLARYRSGESRERSEKGVFTQMPAYHKMRSAVGSDRIALITPSQRDEIARLFTVLRDEGKIRDGLEKAGLEQADVNALMDKLDSFSKFGHLSVKALSNIIPHLEKGLKYDEACAAAGYVHTGYSNSLRSTTISLSDLADTMENRITSPVVRRAVSQTAKVLNAIIREMGTSPVYINIELAREMSKDKAERNKLEKSMEENRKQNERYKQQIAEYKLGEASGQDIVKFKLWNEQGGVCPYSQKQLSIERLFEPGYVDVDHIIPYSICFDDSYNNKVLVLTEENRQKGKRLPLEYLTGERRDKFIVWVNNTHLSFRKKQKLLKEKITQEEIKEWKQRNIQDTQTIASFLHSYIKDNLIFTNFIEKRERHVTPVNGMITSVLRKRWGLNKVRANGDLHHALDAAVVACTTQAMINEISRYYEDDETLYQRGDGEGFAISARTGEIKARFPMPWNHFADELEARLSHDPKRIIRDLMNEHKLTTYDSNAVLQVAPVFVSRMPRRKVTGAAHKETIKSLRKDGAVVRKVALAELKIKDGEIENYYNPDSDRLLYEALKTRLLAFNGSAAKAFAEPFYKPKSDGSRGPIVKKVKLEEHPTLVVELQNGKAAADNETMIRIDVFYVEGDGYYIVPIYVADTIAERLPNRAIVAAKPREQWKEMNDNDFIFSVYPDDLLYFESKTPKTFTKAQKDSSLQDSFVSLSEFVYYKKASISTASITVATHDDTYAIASLGVKTLLKLEKWQVDMLGNKTKVSREKRMGFRKSGCNGVS
ncbi:MAG: type II CRISPR RNA-guided endonuclease Cas9 [Oscillospiraceae bacterium]|jgi:CRISPR-associated endonuclease Csn1